MNILIKKACYMLIAGICLLTWENAFAVQTISAANAPLDPTGQTEGVYFTSPTHYVLTVPINNSIYGSIDTDNSLSGSVNFLGGNTIVTGPLGATEQLGYIEFYGDSSSKVTFQSPVSVREMIIEEPNTVQFNDDVSVGDTNMVFGKDGTYNISENVTVSSNIYTSIEYQGTLILNDGSQITGYVGQITPTLLPIKQITLTGDSTVGGPVCPQNIDLDSHTLSVDSYTSPDDGSGVINTKVDENRVIGNMEATSPTTINDMTVNVTEAIQETGAPQNVITAPSGTSGSIITTTSNNPLYSYTGNNTDGNVILYPNLHLDPTSSLAKNPAKVFEVLFSTSGANQTSDLATITNTLTLLDAEERNDALIQMNPIVDGAIPKVSFDAMKQFHNLWTKHMGNSRCIYPTECCDPCDEEVSCKCNENNIKVWGDAFGYFGHQDARDNFHGFDTNIYGGMVALQGEVNNVTTVGVGAGYADSKIDRNDHDNNSSMQTYDATLFLSYEPACWYVDAALSFDWNQYKDSRHIKFSNETTTINRTAKSDYNGQQYSGFVTTGYRYDTQAYGIITPLASLQYSYLNVEKHSEEGAGDLSLNINNQDYNFLESSIGLKLANPFQTNIGVFIPEVHAIWLHDFFKNDMNLKSSLSGLSEKGGLFSTKGPSQDKNKGDVGISVSFISCKKLSVQLAYNYEFSKTYNSHQGLIKIAKSF